jgi:hypothetical protein
MKIIRKGQTQGLSEKTFNTKMASVRIEPFKFYGRSNSVKLLANGSMTRVTLLLFSVSFLLPLQEQASGLHRIIFTDDGS